MCHAGIEEFWPCKITQNYPHTVCEIDESSMQTYTGQKVATRRPGIQLPVPSDSNIQLAHTVCPSGHWTHELLTCDLQSACFQQDSLRQWRGSNPPRTMTSSCQFPFSETFTCTSGVGRVPYSLVCDHGQDCLDNSDEDFCVHPSCTGVWQFQCSNQQVSWFASSLVSQHPSMR